jgi:hypothetical protein
MSVFSISTLDYLSTRYAPMVTVDQLSEITTEHPVTIRKLVSKGTYAIPSLKLRSKRLFRLTDIAAFIDQQYAAANSTVKRPKRGRPTKIEQLARRQVAEQVTATEQGR